jgi:hypothetical protein
LLTSMAFIIYSSGLIYCPVFKKSITNVEFMKDPGQNTSDVGVQVLFLAR